MTRITQGIFVSTKRRIQVGYVHHRDVGAEGHADGDVGVGAIHSPDDRPCLVFECQCHDFVCGRAPQAGVVLDHRFKWLSLVSAGRVGIIERYLHSADDGATDVRFIAAFYRRNHPDLDCRDILDQRFLAPRSPEHDRSIANDKVLLVRLLHELPEGLELLRSVAVKHRPARVSGLLCGRLLVRGLLIGCFLVC